MRGRIYTVVLKMALITVALALLVDTLFIHVILPAQHQFSNVKKIDRLITQERVGEIPIFGSSIAKRSYYPDSLGNNYFNYGMAGSVYAMIEPLLKIELEKDKDTPILIDFEHHFFLSHQEIRFQMSNYIPHVENSHIRSMLEERGLYSYQQEVPGLRLFGQYDDYLLDLLRLKFRRELANKGGLFFKANKKDFRLYYDRRQRMIDEYHELKSMKDDHPEMLSNDREYKLELLDVLLNSRPDESYVQRFEMLIEQHPQRDFILIYSPQHEIKLMGLENHHEVVSLLESLDEKHSNLHVLDYSLAGFSDEYFHDSGHMNVEGAYRFTHLIRQDLQRIFPQQPELWTPQLTQ